MKRGKNIQIFLMDGDVNGRIKCSVANWTGVAFKVPRTSLDLCKDRNELKQTGVYFLFGVDDHTDNKVVYIGQAGIRKNGEGLLNRILEHNRNPKKDYWTEAVMLTTADNSLGPTEISYLEHRFCQLAMQAKRYIVKNGNDPTHGNISEEKMCELEDFIDYAKIIIAVLGHKVFVPITPEVNDTSSNELLYCKKNGANAIGQITADGFVVKKGSAISSKITNSCPESVIKKRDQNKNRIKEYILQDDILFNSPSGAACFVVGGSANGNTEWKTADGATLKELER